MLSSIDRKSTKMFKFTTFSYFWFFSSTRKCDADIIFTRRSFSVASLAKKLFRNEENTALRLASSNKTEWMLLSCRRMNKTHKTTLFDFSQTLNVWLLSFVYIFFFLCNRFSRSLTWSKRKALTWESTELSGKLFGAFSWKNQLIDKFLQFSCERRQPFIYFLSKIIYRRFHNKI